MTRLILLFALTLSATPVRAQPVEMVVKLTPADMASERQARRKVAGAIEQICRSYATVEHYQWPEIDSCRKAAWASAKPQLATLRGRGRIRLGAK